MIFPKFYFSQLILNIKTAFTIIQYDKMHIKIFILNIILILLASFFEVFGISMLLPMLENLVNSSKSESTNFLTKSFNYLFNIINLDYNFRNILIVFVIIQCFKYFFVFIHIYFSRVLSAIITKSLREITLNKLLISNYKYLSKKSDGEIISTLFVSTQNSGASTENLVVLIKGITYFVFYILTALIISIQFTILLIILILISYLLTIPIFQKVKKLGEEEKRINDQIISNLNNYLKGIKIIKIYNLNKKVKDNLFYYFNNFKNNGINVIKNKIYSLSLLEPFIFLSVILVIIISFNLVYFNISSYIVILIIFTLLIPQLKSINNNILQINSYIPHFYEVKKILNSSENDLYTNNEKKLLFSKIIFDNVTLFYPNNKNFKLNINYTFEKNKTYAIIGPSGSGKTSIINLILKLYSPSEGNIFVDDTNLNKIGIDDWSNNISYIDQENYLFNSSIEENIILDKKNNFNNIKFNNTLLNSNINAKEIDREKIISDNSVNISGGQKQRVSFARAIYKDSDLFILDEFTNELDTSNEQIINDYIATLKGKKTIIIIGHKLKLIKYADEIIFVKNGEVKAVGTHNELMNKSAEYKNYFNES